MSRSTRSRRKQLTRAEVKAYESRRSAEAQRIAATTNDGEESVPTRTASSRYSFALSRDEEYAIIRADLRRLLMIVVVLAIVLIAVTFVLR